MSSQTAAPVTPAQELRVEKCPGCRALVAPDQSYCLNCGARQARARTPAIAATDYAPARPSPASLPGEPPVRDWTAVVALGGIALLALMLVIGVLIGRGGGNGGSKAPQVVVQGGGGTPAATAPAATAPASAQSSSAPAASISEDWPSGKSGWTVELQTIPKAGATASSVDASKSAAAGKGATAVGVLDGSNYNNLGSDYIIYSGDYSTQAAATTALGKLKTSYPAARVLHVVPSGGSGGGAAASTGAPVSAGQQSAGASAIQNLNSCSGSSCSNAARKVTQPIATPGQTTPKDNKAPGGGSSGQSFQ